jgi:hypothetical protein
MTQHLNLDFDIAQNEELPTKESTLLSVIG